MRKNIVKTACAIASIATVCAIASPAKADWEFTKWGMSATELNEASPVKLYPAKNCPSVGDAKLSSDWRIGGKNLTACYIFFDGILHRVVLFSENVHPRDIIRIFSQKYGEPSTRESQTGIKYIWNTAEEQIVLSVQSVSTRRQIPIAITYTSDIAVDVGAFERKF